MIHFCDLFNHDSVMIEIILQQYISEHSCEPALRSNGVICKLIQVWTFMH